MKMPPGVFCDPGRLVQRAAQGLPAGENLRSVCSASLSSLIDEHRRVSPGRALSSLSMKKDCLFAVLRCGVEKCVMMCLIHTVMDEAPTLHEKCPIVTERGIPYQARASREQSHRSSRRSHEPLRQGWESQP